MFRNRFEIPPDKEREMFRYGEKYLESAYFHTSCHRAMLNDHVRTQSYHDAMVRNKFLFKDKVVMDVGCGTGILSSFAVKAGAKCVIAVECTDMADYAMQGMKDNGIDEIVHVVKDKLENIKTLPNGIDKVDIIVSEFMGYSYFFESMMESVLYARDRWLKEGGLMFPDRCTVHALGVSDQRLQRQLDILDHFSANYDFKKLTNGEEYIIKVIESQAKKPEQVLPIVPKENGDSDEDDFTFDLSPLRRGCQLTPFIYRIAPHLCVTDTAKLFDLNLQTLTPAQAQGFATTFELKVQQPVKCEINGIALFFEVFFPKECHNTAHTKFSIPTGPFDPPTHWKQAVYKLDKNITVEKDYKIKCALTFIKNKDWARDWNITFDTKCKNTKGEYVYHEKQDYVSFH